MKSLRFSHTLLVVGLTLGVAALWAGANPMGITGDLVTGGWSTCWDHQAEYWVASTHEGGTCGPCQGTLSRYCYEFSGGSCSGGTISVVVNIPGQPGATAHSSGYTPCGQGSEWCQYARSGDCY